jgi:hypothetical protein
MARIQLDVGIGGKEAVAQLQNEIASLRAELDKLKGSTDNNTKSENTLHSYRKEHIKEMRDYRFVVNQVREAIGGATIALNLMSMGSSAGNQNLKSLTNVVTTGFVAFEGMNAITGVFSKTLDDLGSKIGLAGGQLGLIISIGAAVAGIITSIAGESAKADSELYKMNLKLAETDYQLGLISKQEFGKTLYDNIVKINAEFNKLPENSVNWLESIKATLLSGGIPIIIPKLNVDKVSKEQERKDAEKINSDFIKKEEDLQISSMNTLTSKKKANDIALAFLEINDSKTRANKIYGIEVKAINDEYNAKLMSTKLSTDERTNLEKNRVLDLRTSEIKYLTDTEKIENEKAKLRLDAWEKQRELSDNAIELESDAWLKSEKDLLEKRIALNKTLNEARVTNYNNAINKITSLTAANNPYDLAAQKTAEVEDIKSGPNEIKDKQLQLDALAQVDIKYKKLAVDREYEMYDQIANAASNALGSIATISANSSTAEIDAMEKAKDAALENFDIEKEAKLGVYDAALENDNLTSAQRKKLEKERTATEKDENAKRKVIEKKLQDDINAEKLKAWQTNKALSLSAAIISGAEAVAKAWAVLGPLGWVGAAATTIATAAQIAIIASAQPPKFARGANFIVPSGYQNDSFPMRVQSGEHVQVTPAGQSQSASGVTIVNNFNVPIDNAEWVATAIEKRLTDTGRTIDKVYNNRNANITLG